MANSSDEQLEKRQAKRLPLGEWIVERMNWSWFTCTQSTGGIAVLMADCPKQFAGLKTIGVVIFIFNIALWLLFTTLIMIRFIKRPSAIKKSLTQAPEGVFFGSFLLSIATMIICTQSFGVKHTGPWLVVALRVIFWIYAAVTFISSTFDFVILFKHRRWKAIDMNPAWFLMVYQAMLTGTTASAIAASQPPAQRLPIIVAGITYQGYGWLASLLILVWFLGHLIEKGWPAPSQAPGLFLTVGSVGFTVTALIGNARALPQGYAYFAAHPIAKETLLIVSTWIGIFMWLFGFWLFLLAVVICLAQTVKKEDNKWTLPMKFSNVWWAFIFPNVGFTLSTIYIGEELNSDAILWVSTIMIILLVAFWLLDLFMMAKTIAKSYFVDSEYTLL